MTKLGKKRVALQKYTDNQLLDELGRRIKAKREPLQRVLESAIDEITDKADRLADLQDDLDDITS